MGWFREHVGDHFWPTVAPPSRDELVEENAQRTARRDALMGNLRSLSTAEEVRAAGDSIRHIAVEERARLASVEERLRGLVPLAAVAAAITVAVGIAQLRGELQATIPAALLALASGSSPGKVDTD